MDAGGLGRYNQNEASQSSVTHNAAFPLQYFEVFAADSWSNMSLTLADILGLRKGHIVYDRRLTSLVLFTSAQTTRVYPTCSESVYLWIKEAKAEQMSL